ncbi:MAG: pPIWI-associating nuclease domain-containing protein [Planctomycetota bacterium]
MLCKLNKAHKHNLLGRPYQQGDLENHLGTRFEQEDRALAGRAFDNLVRDGLVEPTYSDLADPDNWVRITDAGKVALERGALDDLDGALTTVAPNLVELRAGAWEAAYSARPDALRQSAHSGRELIDQTLKSLAPDNEVRQQPWFQADKGSRSGVTRRHRITLAMQKRRGESSSSDLKIVEKACELVLAVDDKLMAHSHTRNESSRRDVTDALKAAEIALRRVLL